MEHVLQENYHLLRVQGPAGNSFLSEITEGEIEERQGHMTFIVCFGLLFSGVKKKRAGKISYRVRHQ